MIIIFYDANDEKLYICTETEKTKVVSVNDPDLMSYIPNDDILYVEDAHFITKQQFGDWLSGNIELESQKDTEMSRFKDFLHNSPGKENKPNKSGDFVQSPGQKKYYIHPCHNGTLLLQDIHTTKYPDGIQLNGKWHFVAVDDIGEDILEESNHFKVLLGQGKIEVVDSEFVKKNIHKQKQKSSPSEAALNAILVPSDIKAEIAASDGGIHGSGEIPEFLVEG